MTENLVIPEYRNLNVPSPSVTWVLLPQVQFNTVSKQDFKLYFPLE
jgi:hypothetical protein